MTYLLALLLTHVFRQFLWHIHRPCTGLAVTTLAIWTRTVTWSHEGRWSGGGLKQNLETVTYRHDWHSWHVGKSLLFGHGQVKPSHEVPIRATTEDWNLGACGLPLAPLHLPSARLPLERMVTVECTTGGERNLFFPTVPEHQMSHFAHTSSDHPQLSEGYPLVN